MGLGTAAVTLTGCGGAFQQISNEDSRPNVVLMMADDMGFSDIGCYGGEIDTPNLNRLAANGVRFTQFYNTARCCPTRASLMTGLYPHQADMGWMTIRDLGHDGYHGQLNYRCVTIAEVLRMARLRDVHGRKVARDAAYRTGTAPSIIGLCRGDSTDSSGRFTGREVIMTPTRLREIIHRLLRVKIFIIPMPSATTRPGLSRSTVKSDLMTHFSCMSLTRHHIGLCTQRARISSGTGANTKSAGMSCAAAGTSG